MSERAARDQLADVIVQVLDPDALDPVQQEVALAVADAVLGMIKPLEWDGFVSGAYKIMVSADGIADLWFYGTAFDEDDGPELLQGGYLTLVSIDDHKAAANAHHRAQILAALGLTQANPVQIGGE